VLRRGVRGEDGRSGDLVLALGDVVVLHRVFFSVRVYVNCIIV
jgi:hypothetical protein